MIFSDRTVFNAAKVALATILISAGAVACKQNQSSVQEPAPAEVKVQSTGAIVYFNLDRVLAEYDMANELRSAVETKVQGIQQELTRRSNKLQGEYHAFQEKVNKGLMTMSTAEIQGQQLKQKENEFNTYAAQKQQEMNEEQQVLINRIGDAIKTFLDKYNAEKKYAMILSTQGGILPAPVAVADSSLDITSELIKLLNDDYAKTKSESSKK